VSEDGRRLTHLDGTPFHWLGDTAWELFDKLDRDDAELYLRTRAGQGFTVVQAVALAELEDAKKGNAYGRLPLELGADGVPDPERPDVSGDYSYWDHVDYVVERAHAHGLYVALLPTWGSRFHRWPWEKEPEIFNATNAYAYGRWIGSRYKERPGIVWVLGGDRPLQTRRHFDVVCAMARGLRDGDEGRHLITFHPTGPDGSARQLHGEAWLDFNMVQSGHLRQKPWNYELVLADYRRTPAKPVLDAEPCYEDLPIRFKPENGYFDAPDVRRAAYSALLAGAFGHTYGHHSVWSMSGGGFEDAKGDELGMQAIMSWKDALHRPGAEGMRHVRAFMRSPFFAGLAPDPELIRGNLPGECFRVAARGETAAAVYCPYGLFVDLDLGRLAAPEVEASWFDPRNGEWTSAVRVSAEGVRRFVAPTSGRDQDWVLCLETIPTKERR
jgi:hypothetical protein